MTIKLNQHLSNCFNKGFNKETTGAAFSTFHICFLQNDLAIHFLTPLIPPVKANLLPSPPPIPNSFVLFFLHPRPFLPAPSVSLSLALPSSSCVQLYFPGTGNHSSPARTDHCTEEDERTGGQPFHVSPPSVTHTQTHMHTHPMMHAYRCQT